MVQIEVLRDLRVVVDGEERPPIRSRKARLVLAFLAVKPGPHSRELIASTFWGDGLPAASRNSLSKELGVIKRVLGEGCLAINREAIGLLGGEEVAVDAREFDACREREEYSRALDLWQGDFLQGTSHPWADSERERYRGRLARVHRGVAAEARESGRVRLAEELEASAVELDPAPEGFGIGSVGRWGGAGSPPPTRPVEKREPRPPVRSLGEEVAKVEAGGTLPIRFGLPTLDDVTGGLRPGTAMIIAGRPNMGATTLALTLTISAAIREERGCALFSPELDEIDLAQRLIAMRAGLSGSALRKGQLRQEQWPRVVKAANELESASLYFDDSPSIGLEELERKVEQLQREIEGGLDLVVVDDAHLLSEQSSIGADDLGSAEILFRLRRMARDRGPAVAMTTKISPAVEDRPVNRPGLDDIPGYRNLASRPEQVLLLYREDYYDPEATPPGRLDIQVAENRHGSTGTVSLKLVSAGPRVLEHDFGLESPYF